MTALLLAALLAAPPAAAPVRAVPVHPLTRLIQVDDYPAAALRAGEQGIVKVALDVGAEGRVTACTILASSRSSILDASTCRILRARARFTPARDAAGKPVADRYETAIGWSLSPEPASASGIPAALDGAMREWINCLGPTLSAGAKDLSRTPRAVAEAAFPGCRAPEERLIAAIRAEIPGRTAEEERASLRSQVIARIESARARKQP